MRNLLILVAGLITVSAFASPPVIPPVSDENVHKFDMIITGVTVTDEQKTRWRKDRQKAIDCPSCAMSEQPFPDDVEFAED